MPGGSSPQDHGRALRSAPRRWPAGITDRVGNFRRLRVHL